jgi:FkbM family methyltransferase
VVATRYFEFHGPRKGVYVDVGCFHPKHGSNTYALSRAGWTGINVDADGYKIRVFDWFRPGDRNVCAAVSDSEGPARFYGHAGDTFGSMAGLDLSGVQATAEIVRRGVTSREVRTRTLGSILEESGVRAIDFLSIDVEGHEGAILQTVDLERYGVALVAVEIQGDLAAACASAAHRRLVGSGYRIYSWTTPTVFYCRA